MRSDFAIVIVCALAMIQSPGLCFRGKFSGRGNYDTWAKAVKIHDQGIIEAKAGHVEESIRLLEQAISIYPYDADFYKNLALDYENNKRDFARAASLFTNAIRLEPKDYTLRDTYAGMFFDEGNLTEASKVLTEAEPLARTLEEKAKLGQFRKIISEAQSKKQKHGR